MKKHPKLFCTDMVKAILDDRKWITREVIKEIPPFYVIANKPQSYGPDDYAFLDMADPTGTYPTLLTPRYQKCDLLYVRETFTPDEEWENSQIPYLYKADYDIDELLKIQIKWKPSIHMPKKAARIWLEVLDVRAEKLQDIDNDWEECLREGVMLQDETVGDCNGLHIKVLRRFKELWDSLYAKRGYRWDTNPWVLRIEFKKIKGDCKCS